MFEISIQQVHNSSNFSSSNFNIWSLFTIHYSHHKSQQEFWVLQLQIFFKLNNAILFPEENSFFGTKFDIFKTLRLRYRHNFVRKEEYKIHKKMKWPLVKVSTNWPRYWISIFDVFFGFFTFFFLFGYFYCFLISL